MSVNDNNESTRIEPTIGDFSATSQQIGGDHYSKLKIQPMTYAMENNLNALQFSVLKYITRYQDKGTPIKDLQKARHCIDMLIERTKGDL